MTLSRRTRAPVKTFAKILAVTMALAMPLMFTVSSADARAGGGFSGGSRGARSFSAPRATPTTPNAATPLTRSMAQPGAKAPAAAAAPAAAKGGLLNRPGLLGGLAAGFLGAGLLGMLFGGGLFSGLGGLSSVFGLILQLGLIYLAVRLGMNWWRRRNAPAFASVAANNAGDVNPDAQTHARTGFGFGTGANEAPLEIVPADYEVFERRLGEVQAAWSNEDVEALHKIATPEMVSYFTEDLAANKERGVINKVTDVKLLQGDLAESWREGQTDYATLGLRYALTDKILDRASNRLVDGSETPGEVTEVWTFARRPGTEWELSAIQQA